MLVSLSIQNFITIKSLKINIPHNFTVVTGETGTGKSILINALHYLLGGRGNSNCIRPGTTQADLVGKFKINNQHPAYSWLKKFTSEKKINQCTIQRSINNKGRTKTYINDIPCSLQKLKALGKLLIVIHDQHQHLLLLNPKNTIYWLDKFAGCENMTKEISIIYQEHLKTKQDLEVLQKTQWQSQLDLLSYQVAELAELELQPNEIAKISRDHQRLTDLTDLRKNCLQSLKLLDEQESFAVRQNINQCLQLIAHHAEYEPPLKEIMTLLNDALINVEEAYQRLATYQTTLIDNPEQLLYIEHRLSKLHLLARKHNIDMEQLPEFYLQLKEKLSNLQQQQENIPILQEKLEKLASKYLSLAKQLTAIRSQSAKKLSKELTSNLLRVGMKSAIFKVEISSIREHNFGLQGLDQILFLIKTQPNQPFQIVNKVASGGELSRICLLLQILCNQNNPCGFIFDEADVGIGGHVATVIGQLFLSLGKKRQVICITHSPQIAALGNNHLAVSQTIKTSSTTTEITSLNETMKNSEIARMLGGLEISEDTIAHAKYLIAQKENL